MPDDSAHSTTSKSILGSGLLAGCLFACALAGSQWVLGQAPDAQHTNPTPPAQPSGASQNPQPQLPRVTTTVEVHDNVKDEYLSDSITTGTLDGARLAETPLSVTVVTHELLSDQSARTLADVVKNDASVGEDYAPVGYYGDFQVRGFPIDLATGLQINGMIVTGEQDVPLENKAQVEVLKGISGVGSGVTSGGGVIGFVTKRPALVKTIDLATDHRGSAFGAADFGKFFGSQKQVGARLNLAEERIESYVNGADGWRAMGAGAADWKMSAKAILKSDFEYQHKEERSVSGYQLLGGSTVPDLDRIYPSTMLGLQPWAKPNTFDVYNTGARFDYDLPRTWHVFGATSFSHSLIDDNVVYAYGVSYDDQGNVGCPGAVDAPYYFFCPDGTYGIYDYRNPGELRIDAQAESLVTGQLHTGKIRHELAAGVELFRRSVQMPGYFSADSPVSPNGVVQNGAVYSYIGQENIYQPIEPFHWATNDSGVTQQAGPRRLWEDHHQTALMAADRIHLPGRVQLIVGGREVWLRDHNYSLAATSPCTPTDAPGPAGNPCPTTYDESNQPIYSIPTLPDITDRPVWLPQYAITFTPVSSLTLYGNYSAMLSLGPQAPWWVDNGSEFLDPYFTRQVEVGAKYEPGQRILLSVAGFHMRAPFFYPKAIEFEEGQCTGGEFGGPGSLCFVSQGHETHNGAEFNIEGKASSWLKLNASVAAIHAVSQDTGTSEFDNKQVINVPRVRTALFADVAVSRAHGLYVMPGWGYSARKEATRDDAVSVPGFNLFNLGARYAPGGEQ